MTMKNNTKLIMETWRRFLAESPEDDPRTYDPEDGLPSGPQLQPDSDMMQEPQMSDFDRETQGPDDYVPDELIVDEILEYLHTYPDVDDNELKEMFGAYDEDIQAARSKLDMSREARHQDEMDMDRLDRQSGSSYDSQDASMQVPMPDSDYDM